LLDDPLGRLVVDRGLDERLVLWLQAIEQRDVDLAREEVHRHVDEHRAGLAALGERKAFSRISGNSSGVSTRQARLTNGR
jgi:hypothetical protein